jgi:signal transduction histidine kinase
MTRPAMFGRWWVNLPIRHKGLLVVTLPILTLVAALIVRQPLTRLQEENTTLLRRIVTVKSTVQALQVAMLDVETGARGYAATGRTEFLAPYETGRRAAEEHLDALRQLSMADVEGEHFAHVSTLVARELEIAARIVSLARSGTAAGAPAMLAELDADRQTMHAVRGALDALTADWDALLATNLRDLAAVRRWIRPIVILALILGLIGIVPAGWLFATGIAQRLRGLERNAERLARGERLRREPSRGADEIGSLDLTLRRASILLRSRDRELRAVNGTLQRALHEQELLNKELEAFSYSVSHDLRAPLRSIDGFAQALREDWGDRMDETGQSHLARVRNAAQRMGRLIDDLLRLAKLTRAQVDRSDVDLTQLVREIAEDLGERNPTRKVEWVVEEGLHAWCDPVLTRVLLENLIGNAWKFTSKTPAARIEFSSHARAGARVFVVRDNGAGFDMRYVEKLFAPFQRLHGEREFPGTGVGLATVQRIVQKHGGAVQTTAEVGKGATFTFTLAPDGAAMAVA